MQDTPGLDLEQGSLPSAATKPACLGVSPRSTGLPLLKISSIIPVGSFFQSGNNPHLCPLPPLLSHSFIHRFFFFKHLLYTKTCSASKDADMGQILTLGRPHLATSRPETIHGHFPTVLRSSCWEIIHSVLF